MGDVFEIIRRYSNCKQKQAKPWPAEHMAAGERVVSEIIRKYLNYKNRGKQNQSHQNTWACGEILFKLFVTTLTVNQRARKTMIRGNKNIEKQ